MKGTTEIEDNEEQRKPEMVASRYSHQLRYLLLPHGSQESDSVGSSERCSLQSTYCLVRNSLETLKRTITVRNNTSEFVPASST
jgi:hypothetical protein